MLRVRSLHMQLERIGQSIVFVEEGLADLWDPFVGIRIEITVYGLACPEGDVVQIDHVIVCAAVDEGAKLAVANGQRFLEVGGGFVIQEHHRRLFRLSRCRQAEEG